MVKYTELQNGQRFDGYLDGIGQIGYLKKRKSKYFRQMALERREGQIWEGQNMVAQHRHEQIQWLYYYCLLKYQQSMFCCMGGKSQSDRLPKGQQADKKLGKLKRPEQYMKEEIQINLGPELKVTLGKNKKWIFDAQQNERTEKRLPDESKVRQKIEGLKKLEGELKAKQKTFEINQQNRKNYQASLQVQIQKNNAFNKAAELMKMKELIEIDKILEQLASQQ